MMDKVMILAPLNEGMGSSSLPGGPIPGLGGDTDGTSCMDHVACRVQNALAQCSATAWTRSTDTTVRRCMEAAGIAGGVIDTMSRSASYYTYLQCVGFKVAVGPHFRGGYNAHMYTRDNILAELGCRPINNLAEVRAGDNVAWGAAGCPPGGSCSSNILCCGHVGVLTENLGGGTFLYTSANGGNGTISTSRLRIESVPKIFRCD